MPTASEPYTPEELAALESVADMLSPAECRRLIHQLRQQTARAEAAERERDWTPDGHCNWKTKHGAFVYEYCSLQKGHDGEHVMDVMDSLEAARDAAEQDASCRRTMAVEEMKMRIAAEAECDAARTALAAAEMQIRDGKLAAEDVDHRMCVENGRLQEALAAAQVERARLVAAAQALIDEPRSVCTPFGVAGTDYRPAQMASYLEGIRDAAVHLEGSLAASPHADLAAVRAAVTALQSYADGHVDCTSCARQALTALPSWCREQP